MFRQETYSVGLSRVIRDWILGPLHAKLPSSPGHPEYEEALDQALEASNQRLKEKAIYDDIQFGDQGVVKVFFKCLKLHNHELDLEFPDE